MGQNKDKYEALLTILQAREKEQSLVLSICNNLVSCINCFDLAIIFDSQLKSLFEYDQFCIAVTDEKEEEYLIICCDDQSSKSYFQKSKYDVHDGFFDMAIISPEKIEIELRACISSSKNAPSFLIQKQENGIRKAIAFPLPFQTNKRAVLFLFYKKNGFSREANRLLQSISMQLSITVANILTTQQITEYSAITKNNKTESTQNELILEKINNSDFPNLIGNSAVLQKVLERISQVADSDSTVLICGESGTGKELVAQAIYNLSKQKKKKLITVNCASIPENLIISELFGHEKGSFTGATEKKIGKFELAHNGTIFLDEIGELSLEHQTKLLRVLQEKEIERIGGNKSIPIKVRIIAATNRDLQQEVEEGRFRADLFYRLNVFPIHLPALRERKEDILPLSYHFLQIYAAKNGKKINNITSKVVQAMQQYPWHGNIRELQHAIERSVLLTSGNSISDMEFPSLVKSNNAQSFEIKTLDELQKQYILEVLKYCNGRISGPFGAAIKLNIPPTTLISKMHKLGIKKEHFIA